MNKYVNLVDVIMVSFTYSFVHVYIFLGPSLLYLYRKYWIRLNCSQMSDCTLKVQLYILIKFGYFTSILVVNWYICIKQKY